MQGAFRVKRLPRAVGGAQLWIGSAWRLRLPGALRPGPEAGGLVAPGEARRLLDDFTISVSFLLPSPASLTRHLFLCSVETLF